jgi:hypothetical protein
MQLKEDTCGPPETPYPVMRDALNATGVDIFFSMCEPGNGPQTAPVGRSWGNAWRTDIDDGGLWRPILQNVNTNAALFNYSGCEEQRGHDGFGCGWNDVRALRRRRRAPPPPPAARRLSPPLAPRHPLAAPRHPRARRRWAYSWWAGA